VRDRLLLMMPSRVKRALELSVQGHVDAFFSIHGGHGRGERAVLAFQESGRGALEQLELVLGSLQPGSGGPATAWESPSLSFLSFDQHPTAEENKRCGPITC